jgi:protein-S-isoprenylcysteine O-methyltransferase Ste14
MGLSDDQIAVVLLWILWCAIHSVLIALPVTGYLKKRLGEGYRFYRLIYNLVALGTVIPLALYTFSTDGQPIFSWEGPLAIPKYLLLAASLFLFAAGARQYSLSKLVGIDWIRTREASRGISGADAFSTSGVLGVIRHPWYTAGILMVWSRDFSLLGLLLNIVFSAYFVTGAYLEERKLLREFGAGYREYRKRVSMMFPCKWIKSIIAGPEDG